VIEALAVVAAFVAGSLPFGWWAGRLRGVDVRAVGSGNTGATNVSRALGRRTGAAVMALDILKGVVPVLAAHAVGGIGVATLAAAAAIAGHIFSPFLGFRGGKGVATGCGATLALVPLVGVGITAVWIATIALTRYASLASIAAAIAFPTLAFALGEPWPVRAFAIAGAAVVVWRHRANIARLRAGTESRVGARRASEPVAR
jgi:glycerol-3-phosphate acyltransferase PlsY